MTYATFLESKRPVVAALGRHLEEAAQMREKLIEHVAGYEKEEIEGESDGWQYETAERSGEGWRIAAEAMGIDWMTRAELVEAITPAYTEYIGRRLIELLP